MKPVFLINDTVLFEPDARRVCSRADYPSRAVILHGPVSECLLQLLEHNDQLLSQRDLFAAVWEKQGAVVTTNALYQTIASIRKALKSAGLAEEVIITIPKGGFKSVARLHTGTIESFIERNKAVSLPVLTDISSKKEETETPTLHAPPAPRFWRSSRVYWLAGVLFLFSCSVLYSELKDVDPIFAGYHPIGNVAGCEVYSSWHEKEKSYSEITALAQRYPLPCKTGKVAYMTLNHAQQGISVLICDRTPEHRDARCESIFYRQPYNENE